MSGVQIASLFVMFVSAILLICCVALPYWKVNDPEDTIRDNIQRHEGLWLQCNTYATGNWDCDDFNRFFLGLPAEMQASRGLSISGLVFAIFAIVAMGIGMDSAPCGNDDKALKRRTRMIAGALACISALLVVAAVSWYANTVRINHEMATQRLLMNSTTNLNRYIFGVCLFLGWIGGVFMILAGLLALCTSCGGESYEDARPRYAYRPPGKGTGAGQEYV